MEMESILSSSSSSNYSLNHRPFRPPLHPAINNTSSSPVASPQPHTIAPANHTNHPPPPCVPSISPVTTPPEPHDARYHALLTLTLRETSEREKSRIASLVEHESHNYTTTADYKHALSRERRHATALSLELAHLRCLTRYTSCNIHSLAEINEEARE